jgi:hypothetical protein
MAPFLGFIRYVDVFTMGVNSIHISATDLVIFTTVLNVAITVTYGYHCAGAPVHW